MELDDFEKSADLSSEAQWVDDIPGLPGIRLLVLPSAAPELVMAMNKALRKAPRVDGIVPDEAIDSIQDRVDAAMLVVGWEGFTSKGEPVPFSADTCKTLMSKAKFLIGARWASQQVQERVSTAIEELAKNSQVPSKRKSAAA